MNKSLYYSVVGLTILGLLLSVIPGWSAEQYPFTSYKDIEKLFESKGYTREAWQNGIREVPPIILKKIPAHWKDTDSKKISIKTKKKLFFRLLGPIILYCNDQIIADRTKLQEIAAKVNMIDADLAWLLTIAHKYRVVDEVTESVGSEQVKELLSRVDIIPPSIALAQGANESGWGTSRFAKAGNSLFGQWTWGGKGIASKGKQKGKGDYKVAAFDEPLDSVAAYMLNLNSHHSYKPFRDKRTRLRSEGKKPTGISLVDTLTSYSQRGDAYVKDLKALIHHNYLEPTDDAYLGKGPVIELVPADGSKAEK